MTGQEIGVRPGRQATSIEIIKVWAFCPASSFASAGIKVGGRSTVCGSRGLFAGSGNTDDVVSPTGRGNGRSGCLVRRPGRRPILACRS